jgi:hypothetical protein
MDFPTRKTLWTTKIDDPGLLKIYDSYVCLIGEKQVQVFSSSTGNKIGGIEVMKTVVPTESNIK